MVRPRGVEPRIAGYKPGATYRITWGAYNNFYLNFGNQWATYLSYSLSLQPLRGTPLRTQGLSIEPALLSVKTSIKRAGLVQAEGFEPPTSNL